MKRGLCLAIILLTSFLTACGGGGGGGDDSAAGVNTNTAATTDITSGIAVDPYITNAQFEELSADGKTIQSSIGSSSATGGFSFTDAIRDGSIIQIKLTAKGTHAGENYDGVIKRQVFIGDAQPVIVSPLTTLLANGMSPAAVINMLNSAGLSGLSESDLYTNPMATLVNKTGNITESDLVLLQANMAVNAFMVATGDFSYGGPTAVATSSVSFADIAAMVKESLNSVLYQQLTTAIGADVTVEDMANMAVVISSGAARQIKSGVPIGSVTTIGNNMENAIAIADVFYQNRTGGGTPDPGTGGTPPSTPDGQAIFTGATGATCSACHTVGTGTGIMDLAGDGAKITTKFGGGATHNGNTLTAGEITAVATYLGTTTPGTGTGGTTTPPVTVTPDGKALVESNCIGCHNIGQGGLMDLSGKGNTAYTNITAGHNGVSMTDLEANAVADYLDTLTPPSTPTAPFVHPYFSNPRSAHRNYVGNNGTSNCVSCHGTDLRGSGSAPSCYSCHGKKW
jgi:mono/diheme cytochrome c family protein